MIWPLCFSNETTNTAWKPSSDDTFLEEFAGSMLTQTSKLSPISLPTEVLLILLRPSAWDGLMKTGTKSVASHFRVVSLRQKLSSPPMRNHPHAVCDRRARNANDEPIKVGYSHEMVNEASRFTRQFHTRVANNLR